MKKTTKNIGKYLIEFLIVAFGVFLGVYVSEWKSQKKTNENTEKTLQFIGEEMSANILKLDSSIFYQTEMLKSIDSLVVTLDANDYESIYYTNSKFRFSNISNWRGLGFSELENIMYESAKINGVLQELGISTTQLIARLYQKIEGFTEFSTSVENRMLAIDSDTKLIDVLIIFEMVKFDGIQSEYRLISELKKAIEELQQRKQGRSYRR